MGSSRHNGRTRTLIAGANHPFVLLPVIGNWLPVPGQPCRRYQPSRKDQYTIPNSYIITNPRKYSADKHRMTALAGELPQICSDEGIAFRRGRSPDLVSTILIKLFRGPAQLLNTSVYNADATILIKHVQYSEKP